MSHKSVSLYATIAHTRFAFAKRTIKPAGEVRFIRETHRQRPCEVGGLQTACAFVTSYYMRTHECPLLLPTSLSPYLSVKHNRPLSATSIHL